MDDARLSSRGEIFGRDGMLRASADGLAVAELYRAVRCESDVGNGAPLAGWVGAPREPFSAAVRRAELTPEHFALIATIMYHSEAARSIRDCVGGAYLVASARVFATPPHGPEDPGLTPIFVDAPKGVVRTITFLHDLDHTSSPFELRAQTNVLTPSTARGTMVIFDAQRVQWKERAPLRGARIVLDAVCIPRGPHGAVVWEAGMNFWPEDPARATSPNANDSAG